jgi:RHS repeat-associated protein
MPVAYGNLLTLTTPKGTVTTYAWNHTPFAMGRLMSVQQGSKPATTLDYFNATGLVKDVIAPMPMGALGNNGTVVTSYTYTNLGNPLTITAPPANTSGTQFVTTFAYPASEALGEPMTITDSAGKVTQVGFDSRGNVGWVKDALGYQTGFAPNLADQVQTVTYMATGQTGPGNAQTSVTYLYPGGPRTAVADYDESGYQVRRTGVALGPEAEVTSLNGADQVAYQYTTAYQVSETTEGANLAQTLYSYTVDGYLSHVSYPNADTVQFPSYDNLGRPTSRVAGNGVVTNYGYSDGDGLLSDVMYPATRALNVHFDYDIYDRRADMTDSTGVVTYLFGNQDELIHTITAYTGLSGRQIAYVYYPDGSRQVMQTRSGQYQYRYDLAGRLKSLTNASSEVSAWTYFDNGWLQQQTLGNGVATTYAPNPRGFLTSLQTLPHGASVNSSQFTQMLYDGAGDPTQVNATIPAVPGYGGQTNYHYDQWTELTQEQPTRTPVYTNNFQYDDSGNPQIFRNSAWISYNDENEIEYSAAFQYDQNGNATLYPVLGQATALAYDPEHHLTQVGPSASPLLTAGYNGDGLRVWKQNGTDTSTRVYYLFDGSQPVVEEDSTGTVLKAANTFGANGLLSRNVSGTSTFYSFDPQGNVCQRFNSAGTVLSTDMYDAYGAVQRTPSGTTDVFGFGAQAGYYTDPETGLLLLTNRYYDPGTGRFLTWDPIGAAGGANFYRFVGNNPATYSDPSGQSPVLLLAAGFALYLFLQSEQPADIPDSGYVHTSLPCQIDSAIGKATTFGQGSLQPNLATFTPGSSGLIDPLLLQAGRAQLNGEKVASAWTLRQAGGEPPPIQITPEGVIYDGNSRARVAAMLGEEIPYTVVGQSTPGAGPILERPLFWQSGEPAALPWARQPSLWGRLGGLLRRLLSSPEE